MKLFCKCPLPKVGSDDWPWIREGKFGTLGYTESMPGYVLRVEEEIVDATCPDGSGWHLEKKGAVTIVEAREYCEKDARQRWVRQNLLTMIECEL